MTKVNHNSLLYYQTACSLKLPATLIPEIDGFDIKLGKQRYFFRGGDTPYNLGSSLNVANNKFCMNKILENAGFPVPKAIAIEKNDLANEPLTSLIQNLHFPLVAKPMLGTGLGTDVLCNITNITQLETYINKYHQYHRFITIEEFHGGMPSFRVLVFYNKVIGVVQRFPAAVVGDGIHTINELIAIANIKREQLKDLIKLGPIKVDEEYQIRLAELNMTVDTIPPNNETVVLCYTCNSTRGGTMKSLGKAICPANAKLFCNAAKTLGLNIVGFDVQCEDLLIPIAKSRGVIIEANFNPDIVIHESPLFGVQNKVSKPIMSRLIFKHPIAYLAGLCKNMKGSLSIKAAIIVLILVLGNLLINHA